MAGEQLRISQIGLVARSPEGHAAKGMAIKGHEDLWVEIQANTFRNWVNEHLRSVGMEVNDLSSDFCDGTRLCALVEVLQKRKIRPTWIKHPANQHQYLENVTAALNAIAEDGVKLVNIGNVDIVNGTLKLILGLIWSLIVRYQIGRSKFPPRKLMLAWLKAVLPECRVTNFTTDWNSGVYLSALVDYCEPGLIQHWRHLDTNNSVSNCRNAMEIARSRFGVPMVLEPEYLASPFLDELSGMTYLSYFMKENSPGFRATLKWVNSQLKSKHVSNFTKDWNDGSVLCELVSSLGAPAKCQLSNDPRVWEMNLNNGINAGRKFGVEPLLRAKDMVDQNVEHLGVMAYAANFQWIPPRTAPSLTVAATCDAHTTRIHTATHFKIDFLDDDVDPRQITVEVLGPEGERIDCKLSLDSMGGKGVFIPTHVGMHEIIVRNEGEIVKGCPFHVRAMPEVTAIKYTGMEPCAVGSIVEVLVNSNGARSGSIEVIASSPTGRNLGCPVNERNSVYTATFQPDEPGEWKIAVRHGGELIQGGPFTCFVFDPNGVKLLGLETPAVPESIFNFTIDASGTGGLGQIIVDIVQDKHSLPHTIDRISDSLYRVSLHTRRPGKYRVYVYFNGTPVKGSPFPLRVGTRDQVKAERHSSPFVKVTPPTPQESSRFSAFDRVNSPVMSHSPSPLGGFRGMSPLASPLRSPVEKVSPGYRQINTTVNGSLRPGGMSPLHSPAFRSTPSPSHNYQYNSSSVDTSSNVRVSAMLSNLSQRRDSWDALVKTQNVLNESDGVKASGDALQLLCVRRCSSFTVETEASLNQILVTVATPSKQSLPVKIVRSSEKQVVAYFTTTEVGEHVIDVKINDQRIPGSPFRSHAYDAGAIKVGRIPNGVVGHPVEFEIDGSGAGSGNLEILVNGGHVTSFVRNLGSQRFLASFVPHEALSHTVEMKFNGESVPGSPWQVAVMSGSMSGVTPKMAVIGEAVKLVPVDHVASFQISALGFLREDIRANVISPSKRAVHSDVVAEPGGIYRIEFTPSEVGSHLVEVTVADEKLPAGPLLAKVYNAALIRVTDVGSGVVGQPCQFRVDASQAGEGQLEISINEGEVPNHVTVVGGGRCLVSFTPEMTKPHLIDIKFNGETVTGCPFVCSVMDTSRVSVNLSSLELVPVNQVARFHMTVDSSGSAELAVAITGPSCELPVKVTGNVHSGFTAEFTPREVGPHSISVEYNGHPVSGTPFIAKAYDARRVYVGPLPQGHVGNSLQFTVDASQAGEGNLEITISARGANIPTQVHPQGNAKFAVSFVPIEPTDHVISIYFNKEAVPGSPFIASVVGDFPLVTGASLSHAPLGADSYFTMSNVAGSLEDIEVNVEGPMDHNQGPSGQSVPAQVKDAGGQTFKVEFCPRVVGEHKIAVNYRQVPVAGSPFSCKVYDVNAIRVKSVARGTVGQPITFLVETSQAGPGNLEVTVNGGRVATSAQAQGPHTYAISFTPRQATVHTVDLRFNGQDVPGSPFSCNVTEAARVVLSGEDKVSVDKPATFIVECEPSLGPPQVQVLSPSRQPVHVNVKVTDIPGRYSCQLIAKDVGDHSVEVKLSGNHVEGSPFLIKAYDATKVRVTDINTGVVGKPVYFSINASQAGAGNLEIIVSVNGCNVPNYVQSEGNAKFRVNFKPREAAPHSLSVRFNGEPIPGSPFTCRVLQPGHVNVSGSGLKMTSAGRPAVITIDGANNCDVVVTSPSNRKLPVKIDNSDSRITAEFTPVEVGRHVVAIEADGQPVKGSPFTCNVYNVNNIKVTGLGPAKVGKPVTFSVDATQAGEGTLELVISTEQSTVKAEVVACSRGLYDVTFVPHQLAPHFVNITFNEEDVPGSPLRCEVLQVASKKATATARGEGLNQVVLGTAAYFEVNPHTPEHGTIDAQVIGPDGNRVACTLEKLETGLYRGKYRPVCVGTHNVTITQRKQPITKQPFTVQVFDPLQVKLTDLSEAFCHRAATFKVDTRGSGSGALSVNIRAAGSEVKHTLRELDLPGLYQVVYHPQLAIPHRIHVKYNNMNIAGCPMEVVVQDPAVGRDVCATGLGLYQSRAGRVTHFVIETAGRPAQEFDVVITGPQGAAVPVRCYQQKDGNLMAEFTAATTGVYKIDVLQGSRPVRGSPYHCQVFDATKVKLEKLAANSVSVNENISFKLHRKNAGFAELDVTVRSPLGQDLPLSVRSIGDDTDLIELCPSLPGNYCFHITYGGDSIPDSPLTFTVVESGVARAWGPGLSRALVDVPAKFSVACSGIGVPARPDVTLDGPDNILVKCNVTKANNEGEYELMYTAPKVGAYDISISCSGKPIAGSPFRVYVVCVDRVRLIGDLPSNRMPLAVHTPTRITFDISQAGPGDLVAECRGPHNSTVPVSIESPTPDRLQVLVTPRAVGPHSLHLTYGGFPLPCSPVTGLAEGGTGGVRVILTGKGLAGAVCNHQAEFTIDGSQAGPGMPEVSLTGMKNDIKVTLQNIGDNIYRATYTPTYPGAYLLNVMWSDRQVKGCPLKVTVTAVCDASKVMCSGEGLGFGTVGKDIRSFIDTRAAGPGELSAHCVGPHKVAYCELYDHSDGTFTLNVKPQEAGRHTLTVKYGGVDVPGSPFSLRISGAPDASKVRVYGPGIEHGVLATFQSRFICDTRGAGAGQLTVRVRGPKGAFRVEMQRESQKDRTILCKYDPTEPGDYRVEVKWAGEHVPGSPFLVMIFDTQEELNRFLQGSQSPGSDLYGSVAYSTGYAHITP